MTTTTNSDPTITLRIRRDGTGEVSINGVPTAIHAPAVAEARAQGIAQLRDLAEQRGTSLRFRSYDPEGEWDLVIDPDGRIREAPDTATAIPEPSTKTAAARRSHSDEAAPVAPTAAPARAYDSTYVVDTIVPITAIGRATRGWRARLGLGPSRQERAERADREAACQAFGRPVTIMVADPRGGSGKTTLSILLSGAFGTARGGGVIALENHELRGTMHLRTAAVHRNITMRDVLANDQLRLDTIRAGDLAGYVRHQTAGQYDVLVSATRSDRAIRRDEFLTVHTLLARFYQVIIVDTANNEDAENWQAAAEQADALVVPIKWRNDYSVPAIEMLEELENSGDPRLVDLVRNAVVVASHNFGDVDQRCRAQLRPFFQQRTKALIEIAPDRHIAEGNVIRHDQLMPATRRQAERVAAEVARAVSARIRTEG